MGKQIGGDAHGLGVVTGAKFLAANDLARVIEGVRETMMQRRLVGWLHPRNIP
jgi:hypothetical protein